MYSYSNKNLNIRSILEQLLRDVHSYNIIIVDCNNEAPHI